MNEPLKNTIEKIIFAKYESEKKNFQHKKCHKTEVFIQIISKQDR